MRGDFKRKGKNMKNMIENFIDELTDMNETNKEYKIKIVELKLKAAMYKAYFYHKSNLAEKLNDQIVENLNHCIGEFDGFCYSSSRANAKYKTLEDMVMENIITDDEYDFCIRL